jgi:hypothetical protein
VSALASVLSADPRSEALSRVSGDWRWRASGAAPLAVRRESRPAVLGSERRPPLERALSSGRRGADRTTNRPQTTESCANRSFYRTRAQEHAWYDQADESHGLTRHQRSLLFRVNGDSIPPLGEDHLACEWNGPGDRDRQLSVRREYVLENRDLKKLIECTSAAWHSGCAHQQFALMERLTESKETMIELKRILCPISRSSLDTRSSTYMRATP